MMYEDRRQVVNPRHQTSQGQSVAKPETPLQNLLEIKFSEMLIDIQIFLINENSFESVVPKMVAISS